MEEKNGEGVWREAKKESPPPISKKHLKIPCNKAERNGLREEFAVYCWFSGKLRRLNMWMIVSHLLYNFLDGFEKSGSIYPKLKLTDGDNLDYFDFTTNTLVDILLSNEVPF